jgi:hypothetical protein
LFASILTLTGCSAAPAPGSAGPEGPTTPASSGATGGAGPAPSEGGGGVTPGGSPSTPDAGAPSPSGGARSDAGSPPSVPPAGASRGKIVFHLLLGVSGSTAGDSIDLGADAYTDLIASNLVAGVMYGHLVTKLTPGILFEKDYLYGSIFGQLLQENLATELYDKSSSLIDSSPQQQAVMGAGQGGPYQINNYAADMVHGSYAPQGNALINYVAVQKNIGYPFASAATQYTQPTPAPFNDKLYGPMLTAYFHYNDYVALQRIGPVGGYTPGWEPAYDDALSTFKTLPGAFLDVILNVAYNQGYYGTLLTAYAKQGASATAATVTSVNDYASVWGVSDTYRQYPYQVRYYLDQLYDNPAPMTGAVPDNHVVLSVAGWQQIFAGVFQKLAYTGSSGYAFISADQANAAFTAAAGKTGLAAAASLDVGNAAQRAQIFALLEAAIAGLESSLGTDFSATTLSAL